MQFISDCINIHRETPKRNIQSTEQCSSYYINKDQMDKFPFNALKICL